jgi:hypothetical protein
MSDITNWRLRIPMAKTVFVVLGWVDYEGSDVLAVFSTLSKAQAFVVEFDQTDHYYFEIDIQEYNLDEVPLGV